MDNNGRRRRFPRGLYHPQLSDGIDPDVPKRVTLTAHMTGLRGQIENYLGSLAEWTHVDIAKVGSHQIDVNAFEVRQICAAAKQERIHGANASAPIREGNAEIGAEESRTAGYENLTSAPVHSSPLLSRTNSAAKDVGSSYFSYSYNTPLVSRRADFNV
jgi:hypothetical protein